MLWSNACKVQGKMSRVVVESSPGISIMDSSVSLHHMGNLEIAFPWCLSGFQINFGRYVATNTVAK